MIAIACITALSLLWGRVIALRFGWPTWLATVSLAALGANLATHTGWRLWVYPAFSLAALGLATLAISQLTPASLDVADADAGAPTPTQTTTPTRPHIWWATLGAGSALAALTEPAIWPCSLFVMIWCGRQLRAGLPLARWGLSSFVLTCLVGAMLLHYSNWPTVAPTFTLPAWPTIAAGEVAIDIAGPMAAAFAVIGLVIMCAFAPWVAIGTATSLLFLSHAPWQATWRQSWLWAAAFACAATIGLGWLASRPKRPALRIILWLALLLAAMVPPVAAWVL